MPQGLEQHRGQRYEIGLGAPVECFCSGNLQTEAPSGSEGFPTPHTDATVPGSKLGYPKGKLHKQG